jgi:hypothetical protein
VYELPSEPAIVTFVAFVAATVSVADAPAATVVGLDEMLTVGNGGVTLPLTPPHPTAISTEANANNLIDIRQLRLRRRCGAGNAFPLLSLN